MGKRTTLSPKQQLEKSLNDLIEGAISNESITLHELLEIMNRLHLAVKFAVQAVEEVSHGK